MIDLAPATTTIIVFAVLLCIMMLVVATLKKRSGKEQPYLYEKEASLLSPGERSFFTALEAAVGNHHRIFAKVRLADILKIKDAKNRSTWQKAFNPIQSKHVDFLACDPEDMSIRFVVELDDKSHQRQDRQDRDVLVDRILTTAGIPFFRFPAKSSYSAEEIRKRISDKFTDTRGRDF
jgi:very-short-patch-repair endonuclease